MNEQERIVARTPEFRVRQLSTNTWAMEQRLSCPCPDCDKLEHSTWVVQGGSTTQEGAQKIQERRETQRLRYAKVDEVE